MVSNEYCGLKSRSRNVIMKVQFSAAARRCPSSGLLILRAQIVHINESQGKLALFRTYNNILLTVLHNLFSLTLLLFFISTFPPPHRPYIDPRWTSLHLHFLLLVSIVFPPPALPSSFLLCSLLFSSTSSFSFLLFSLLLLIFILSLPPYFFFTEGFRFWSDFGYFGPSLAFLA